MTPTGDLDRDDARTLGLLALFLFVSMASAGVLLDVATATEVALCG